MEDAVNSAKKLVPFLVRDSLDQALNDCLSALDDARDEMSAVVQSVDARDQATTRFGRLTRLEVAIRCAIALAEAP